MALIKGREIVFKGFESGKFLKLKASEQSSDLNDTDNTDNTNNRLLTPMRKETELKILTSKQMVQKLPIALTHVKAANHSESL